MLMPLVGHCTLRISSVEQYKADTYLGLGGLLCTVLLFRAKRIPLADAGTICKLLRETLNQRRWLERDSCLYLGDVATEGVTLYSSLRVVAQVPSL